MTNFGNFGPILMKLGGEVYFILINSILLSNTGTGKILSVRNSVVDPCTVQIYEDDDHDDNAYDCVSED